MADRMGDWMQTYTGRQFWPLDPRPDDIDPRDIAHALSMQCRYNGHSLRFYSVAEHCVLLSQAVPADLALWALLHDASEAYVGDMIRPLKHNVPGFEAIEDGVLWAISARFGVSWPMPRAVSLADARILRDERAAIMVGTEHRWVTDQLEPLGVRVEGWSPMRAEAEWMGRLNVLWSDPYARQPEVVDLVAALRSSIEAAKQRRLEGKSDGDVS